LVSARRPPLGQHFLQDPGYRQRIAGALELRGGETVIEIGPGRGAITELLAERAGRLVAIEIDGRLAAGLRERFQDHPQVEVVQADILEAPLDYGPARVIGNLPYYITSPILLRLFERAAQWERIVVMVQREVAERLVAAPGTRAYGLLSVTAQYYTQPRLLFRIPQGAFQPRPKVESAVVRMDPAPRRFPYEAEWFRLVRAAFRQKRKTLMNNLRGMWAADDLRRALGDCGLPASARAEELSIAQFERLFLLLGGR
jgi:16S rRNA (adenine1518-N6/adenine1519-N6)-dimethyltransferase